MFYSINPYSNPRAPLKSLKNKNICLGTKSRATLQYSIRQYPSAMHLSGMTDSVTAVCSRGLKPCGSQAPFRDSAQLGLLRMDEGLMPWSSLHYTTRSSGRLFKSVAVLITIAMPVCKVYSHVSWAAVVGTSSPIRSVRYSSTWKSMTSLSALQI